MNAIRSKLPILSTDVKTAVTEKKLTENDKVPIIPGNLATINGTNTGNVNLKFPSFIPKIVVPLSVDIAIIIAKEVAKLLEKKEPKQ